MADRRLELIDRLSRRLEEVLSAFEGRTADSGAAQAEAWLGCRSAFDDFRKECERCTGAPRPEGLHEGVQRALKLQAIAVSVLGREQDWLREEIRGMADKRTRLRAFAAPPRIGDSCDIEG